MVSYIFFSYPNLFTDSMISLPTFILPKSGIYLFIRKYLNLSMVVFIFYFIRISL